MDSEKKNGMVNSSAETVYTCNCRARGLVRTVVAPLSIQAVLERILTVLALTTLSGNLFQ